MLLNKITDRLKVLTDSRYREFYLQRRETDLFERERRANAVAAQLPAGAALPLDFKAQQAAQNLKEDGYAMVSDLLPPEWVSEMTDYFSQNECSDPYQQNLGSFKVKNNPPKGVHVAQFNNEIVVRAPHAFEIANDSQVLSVVTQMLGAKPTISLISAWWSLPADGTAQQAENFHRDVDDWRFVKLFCYLTDVDETSGPHVFVKGSHKENKLTQIRRFTDAETEATFGADSLLRFTGPAGTAFLENTYGVHRGTPPTDNPRLIFQVLYSLRPVIYGPKIPLVRAGANGVPKGLDPFINRVYCEA
jgi:hypothetical protein